jgi:hypothetical protein
MLAFINSKRLRNSGQITRSSSTENSGNNVTSHTDGKPEKAVEFSHHKLQLLSAKDIKILGGAGAKPRAKPLRCNPPLLRMQGVV